MFVHTYNIQWRFRGQVAKRLPILITRLASDKSLLHSAAHIGKTASHSNTFGVHVLCFAIEQSATFVTKCGQAVDKPWNDHTRHVERHTGTWNGRTETWTGQSILFALKLYIIV